MIFFADESLDRQIITRLRQDGHVVLDVTEMDPGISDDRSSLWPMNQRPFC